MTTLAESQHPVVADDDWHTPDELAPKIRRSAYQIREWLRTEALHGHCVRRRWTTKKTVYDAYRQGLDLAAQRRICGCPEIAGVPSPRGRRRPGH